MILAMYTLEWKLSFHLIIWTSASNIWTFDSIVFFLIQFLASCLVQYRYLSSKHIKSTFLSLFAHLLLSWLLASFYAGRHQFPSLFWNFELVHTLRKRCIKKLIGQESNNALIIHCFLSQSQALHDAKLVMYCVLFSWFCVPLAI